MDSKLLDNLLLYKSIRNFLLNHYEGKFALIIAGELIDIYNSESDAYASGLQSHGDVPIFIQQIVRKEEVVSVTALTGRPM